MPLATDERANPNRPKNLFLRERIFENNVHVVWRPSTAAHGGLTRGLITSVNFLSISPSQVGESKVSGFPTNNDKVREFSKESFTSKDKITFWGKHQEFLPNGFIFPQ